MQSSYRPKRKLQFQLRIGHRPNSNPHFRNTKQFGGCGHQEWLPLMLLSPASLHLDPIPQPLARNISLFPFKNSPLSTMEPKYSVLCFCRGANIDIKFMVGLNFLGIMERVSIFQHIPLQMATGWRWRLVLLKNTRMMSS